MEEGTVVTSERGRIMVEVEAGSSCEGCAMGHSCILVEGARRRRLWMENTLDARIGDRVRFDIHPGAVILGSALHYALPVAFLLVGILAGALLGPRAGLEGEIASIAGGVIGIALSGLCIAVLSAIARKKTILLPRLMKILPGSQEK